MLCNVFFAFYMLLRGLLPVRHLTGFAILLPLILKRTIILVVNQSFFSLCIFTFFLKFFSSNFFSISYLHSKFKAVFKLFCLMVESQTVFTLMAWVLVTLQTGYCKEHPTQYKLHIAHFTLHTSHNTLYSANLTLHTSQCKLHTTHRTGVIAESWWESNYWPERNPINPCTPTN